MLKGKYGDWALITGASSGIGEAFARRFASEGLNIVIIARRIERLNAIAAELESQYNIKVISIGLDLTVRDFLKEIESKIGNIEIGILVNNAGAGMNGSFKDLPVDKSFGIIQLNCIAPTILTSYFANKMIARRKGSIIFLGSTVSFNPIPFMSIYSATKAFNYFLGSSLWYELKQYNIDVITIAPGSTDTEFPRMNKNSRFLASPDDVVTTTLNALGKKVYVVDGKVNKLYIQLSKFIPKKYLLRLIGKSAEKKLKNIS